MVYFWVSLAEFRSMLFYSNTDLYSFECCFVYFVKIALPLILKNFVLSRVGEIMNEIVNDYGVVWVASAGNHGK